MQLEKDIGLLNSGLVTANKLVDEGNAEMKELLAATVLDRNTMAQANEKTAVGQKRVKVRSRNLNEKRKRWCRYEVVVRYVG